MGFFSWCFCDTTKTMKCAKRLAVGKKGYLLIPKDFGSGHIEETHYGGYGIFGRQDVYDLVAIWNREYMAAHPGFVLPSYGEIRKKSWYRLYADTSIPIEELEGRLRADKDCYPYMELREIGIALACYDEDNAALPYPIKVAGKARSVYEACMPSVADPKQGCY